MLWKNICHKNTYICSWVGGYWRITPVSTHRVNSARPGRNGRHSADDIFRYIFVNEKVCILIENSLKFIPINNNPALGSDNGLAPNRRQAIFWIIADPIHWRIYAALGGDECINVVIHWHWGNTLINTIMMTSSNGNIFRDTDPLCGKLICHRWIPRTQASDAELWCFLWSTPFTGEFPAQTASNVEMLPLYDVIMRVWLIHIFPNVVV